MTFTERLLRFGVGVVASVFLVILFFGRRNSCKNYLSNYLPEGRVLAEMQYKPLVYTEEAFADLSALKLDTATFRTEILPNLNIDFDKSDQRAKPCGKYVTFYQDSTYNFQVNIEKCKEEVNIISIQ